MMVGGETRDVTARVVSDIDNDNDKLDESVSDYIAATDSCHYITDTLIQERTDDVTNKSVDEDEGLTKVLANIPNSNNSQNPGASIHNTTYKFWQRC